MTMYALELGFSDESGALLLFRVDSQAEADEIVAADPYYSGPGVRVVSLKESGPLSLWPPSWTEASPNRLPHPSHVVGPGC
jgi:hypothetical protein